MSRKVLICIAVVGMVNGIILPDSFAEKKQSALLPDFYPIQASITAEPIDLVANIDPMAFHRAAPGMTVFSNLAQGHPRCTIENQGYATVGFTVRAEMTGPYGQPGWMMGSSLNDIGMDQCVVAAIFTQPLTTTDDPTGVYARDLVDADFSDNDVIGPIEKVATTDVLARDNSLSDPDDGEYVKGYNVTPWPDYAIRSLRFMIQTPTAWIYEPPEQTLLVIIGAVVE